MSKRSIGKPHSNELPPGMTALQASTPAGDMIVAVWRAFHDATPFEYEYAQGAPDMVRALREARRKRSDLPEGVWQRCVRLVSPTLSWQERQNPKEILTAIAVLRPPRGDDAAAYLPPVRRRPGRPGWTEALFLKRWHEAESKAAPSDRLADIAAVFRARDGKVGGIGIHSLRRLLRRFTT